MTKRLKIIAGSALGMFSAFFLLYEFHWREPSYQGKTLNEWLAESENAAPEKLAQIVAAVRHMGKRALPHAFAMLHATDSEFREQVAHFMSEYTAFEVTPSVPPERLHERALLVIVALRNQYQEVITRRMVKELNQGKTDLEITQVLALMGTNGLPFLVRALTNQNPIIRANAAFALCVPQSISDATNRTTPCNALGLTSYEARNTANTYASAAVAPLLSSLSDPDPRVRYAVATALDNLGERPTNSIPIFVFALQSNDAPDRRMAATRLRHFGKAAADSVPTLIPLLNDPDEAVRSAAKRTLNEIGPAALDK
jgi:hypothetical protein